MSSAAASRKPNVQEQKIHQAALADPRKSITPKECEALVPDSKARMDAINFLLATGLLKAMKDTKGNVLFRAVMKKEMEVKKDMSGEESMVLSHIQASGNEGIWTKHLKAKTELHQTVIDRCLKSLTQKQLIKAAKSVEFPTRKMYMLYHLDPSVKMTGGPWYTDNELDTEFIKLLCSACLRFIRDRSLPKASSSTPNNAPLYPIGVAPSYPTAAQVLNFLRKSRITETTLEVEHAEMLLGVLVLDGDVERLPAFGAAMWESNMEATTGDGSDDETRSSSSKKRKRKDKEREGSLRKRKRSKRSHSDAESDSEDSDPEDDRRSKSKSKSKTKDKSKSKSKSKSKRRSKDESDKSDSDDGSEKEDKTRKKRRKRSKQESDEESDDEGKRKKKSKSKSKKKKSYSSDEDSDSESESSRTASSDSDTDARPRSKSKSKSKSKRSSPALQYSLDAGDMDALEYGAHVYRAVRQEYAGGVGLGQAPCTRCPTFDFCKPGGPVNPSECVYYGEWLGVAPGGVEKEDADQRAGKDDQLTGIDF